MTIAYAIGPHALILGQNPPAFLTRRSSLSHHDTRPSRVPSRQAKTPALIATRTSWATPLGNISTSRGGADSSPDDPDGNFCTRPEEDGRSTAFCELVQNYNV